MADFRLLSRSAVVVVFSRSGCGYCSEVKRLFDKITPSNITKKYFEAHEYRTSLCQGMNSVDSGQCV